MSVGLRIQSSIQYRPQNQSRVDKSDLTVSNPKFEIHYCARIPRFVKFGHVGNHGINFSRKATSSSTQMVAIATNRGRSWTFSAHSMVPQFLKQFKGYTKKLNFLRYRRNLKENGGRHRRFAKNMRQSNDGPDGLGAFSLFCLGIFALR